MYVVYTVTSTIYAKIREDSKDGFRKKSKRKDIKRNDGILLKNHDATMALLTRLPNSPFEKSRGRLDEKGMHECTLALGFLTPRQRKTMIQRLRHHPRDKNRLWSPPSKAKTAMTVEDHRHHGHLYLFSNQLKKYFK